ncbi:MAG: hypothetical protein ACE14L_05670 [Terriglobales bacterium]
MTIGNPNLRRDPPRARQIETLGLVLIAVLILIITLVRFGRFVNWSWR